MYLYMDRVIGRLKYVSKCLKKIVKKEEEYKFVITIKIGKFIVEF